jgi:hypothetical protein
MVDAGRMALEREADQGGMSLASVATNVERWSQFVSFAKENGVARMENISQDLVIAYGNTLIEKVDTEQLSPSYAQNLVSSINVVMSAATGGQWQSVGPVTVCHLPQRSAIRNTVPGSLDRLRFENTLAALRESGAARGAAIAELARDLGLRSKEASLLDARVALRQAQETGSVHIVLGTKGGYARGIPVNTLQMDVLRRAANVQGIERGVMPGDKNWREWREGGLRAIRETVQQYTNGGLHDLRAAYACQRYREITGHLAPVEACGKLTSARAVDYAARLQIAQELGHNRVDVVAEYIGGRG